MSPNEGKIKDKTIILGVTASVAAYKAPDIARRLVKSGATVYPVLTKKATDFIGALALEAVSCQEVPNPKNSRGTARRARTYFQYLELAKKADFILIAPATANIIAHIAHGYASDLLETLVLARGCPLIIAPAMNERMWLNEITQENVAKLKKLGIEFIGPAKGDLACGDEGIGRLAEIDDIIEVCKKISTKQQAPNSK